MKKSIYVLAAFCSAGIGMIPKIAIASWCIEVVDSPKHFLNFYSRAIAIDGTIAND